MRPRVLIGAFAAAGLLGAAVARAVPPGDDAGRATPAGLSTGLFDEAAALIERHFWRPISRQEIERRAVRALLAEIDPYGRHFDAQEWRDYEAGLASRTASLGVYVGVEPGAELPRVRYLLLESAAAAAGVRQGDWIESIDGRSMAGLGLEDVVPLLRGEAGSRVEIALRRGADPTAQLTIRVEVTRKEHRAPSIHGVGRDAEGRAKFLLSDNPRIGYLRIDHLAEGSASEVEAALRELEALRASALILDLRDSYGGLMMAAIEIADFFLDEGLIAGEDSRQEDRSFVAQPGVLWTHPVLVLIDGGTASSSEFLAAALRDRGRARFLGERTFGKGLVQKKYALSGGLGGLVLSTGRHVRPAGIAADRNDPPAEAMQAGVAPDPGLEFVVEGAERERWADAMYLRASSALVPEADLAAAGPDRMLDRAMALLGESSPTP